MATVLTHSKLTCLYHSSAMDNKPGNHKWLQGAVFVKRLTGIPRIVWKVKVHYCSPKSLILEGISILSQTSSVYSLLSTYFRSILWLSSIHAYVFKAAYFLEVPQTQPWLKHTSSSYVPCAPSISTSFIYKTNIILRRRISAKFAYI
jgi:hypothetical protein